MTVAALLELVAKLAASDHFGVSVSFPACFRTLSCNAPLSQVRAWYSAACFFLVELVIVSLSTLVLILTGLVVETVSVAAAGTFFTTLLRAVCPCGPMVQRWAHVAVAISDFTDDSIATSRNMTEVHVLAFVASVSGQALATTTLESIAARSTTLSPLGPVQFVAFAINGSEIRTFSVVWEIIFGTFGNFHVSWVVLIMVNISTAPPVVEVVVDTRREVGVSSPGALVNRKGCMTWTLISDTDIGQHAVTITCSHFGTDKVITT